MSLYAQLDGVSRKIRYFRPRIANASRYDRKLYAHVDGVDRLIHESFGTEDIAGFVYRIYQVNGYDGQTDGYLANSTTLSKTNLSSYGNITLSGDNLIQVYSAVNKAIRVWFNLYAIRNDGSRFQYSSPNFIPNDERLPLSHNINSWYNFSTISNGAWYSTRYIGLTEYPSGNRTITLTTSDTTYVITQPVEAANGYHPMSITSGNSPNGASGAQHTVTVYAQAVDCILNGKSVPITFDLNNFA